MQVICKETFQPVTIIIESRAELEALTVQVRCDPDHTFNEYAETSGVNIPEANTILGSLGLKLKDCAKAAGVKYGY